MKIQSIEDIQKEIYSLKKQVLDIVNKIDYVAGFESYYYNDTKEILIKAFNIIGDAHNELKEDYINKLQMTNLNID